MHAVKSFEVPCENPELSKVMKMLENAYDEKYQNSIRESTVIKAYDNT